METEITQEELRQLLHYDPETGIFTWLQDRSDKVKAGHVAGCKADKRGYKRICINYKIYPAHHQAAKEQFGEFYRQKEVV